MTKCGCEEAGKCICEDAVVCARHVSHRYDGQWVLREVTLCVERGEFLGIIGPNGGGKTTLIKLIVGLLPLVKGEIEVFGRPVSRLGKERSKIGYIPQRREVESNFPATALDVVLMGAYGHLGLFRYPGKELKHKAAELLERVGLKEYVRRSARELSEGQLQRLYIAQGLIGNPELLILDEPLRGVDTLGQRDFFELLGEVKQEFKLTLIMVSHQIEHLAEFADMIACICGRLHWHDRSELMSEEVLEQLYACELEHFLKAHIEHIDKYHRPKG